MAKQPHRELGARIHAARVRRGYSYSQFAACCGVSELAVRNWEKGVSRPTEERLAKAADGLGVPLAALRQGNAAWDEVVTRIKPLPGPHVFQWPTQFDPALGESDEAGVGPYRAPPGLNEPAPRPAAVLLPAARLPRRKRQRLPAPPDILPDPPPMTIGEARRLASLGVMCALCWERAPAMRRNQGRFCPTCMSLFPGA